MLHSLSPTVPSIRLTLPPVLAFSSYTFSGLIIDLVYESVINGTIADTKLQ